MRAGFVESVTAFAQDVVDRQSNHATNMQGNVLGPSGSGIDTAAWEAYLRLVIPVSHPVSSHRPWIRHRLAEIARGTGFGQGPPASFALATFPSSRKRDDLGGKIRRKMGVRTRFPNY